MFTIWRTTHYGKVHCISATSQPNPLRSKTGSFFTSEPTQKWWLQVQTQCVPLRSRLPISIKYSGFYPLNLKKVCFVQLVKNKYKNSPTFREIQFPIKLLGYFWKNNKSKNNQIIFCVFFFCCLLLKWIPFEKRLAKRHLLRKNSWVSF